MRAFQLASLLSLAATAFAQQVVFSQPASGTVVTSGSTITVQINRPNFQSSATEMSIALGIRNCFNSGSGVFCPTPADGLGTLLYNGPFTPPRQNLTVTIPQFLPPGQARLNLYHVSLIGAGLLPWSETLSLPITIA